MGNAMMSENDENDQIIKEESWKRRRGRNEQNEEEEEEEELYETDNQNTEEEEEEEIEETDKTMTKKKAMWPSPTPMVTCLGYRNRNSSSKNRVGCIPSSFIYYSSGERNEARGFSSDDDGGNAISMKFILKKPPSWSMIKNGETLRPRINRLAELKKLIADIQQPRRQKEKEENEKTTEDDVEESKEGGGGGNEFQKHMTSLPKGRRDSSNSQTPSIDVVWSPPAVFLTEEEEEENRLQLIGLLEELENIYRDVERVAYIAKKSFKICNVSKKKKALTKSQFLWIWSCGGGDCHERIVGEELFDCVDKKHTGRINYKSFQEDIPLVALEIIDANLKEWKNMRQTFRYSCI